MMHGIIKIFLKDNKFSCLIANILIIAFVFLIKNTQKDIYFSIDSAFLAYPFFNIGYILRKYFNKYCEVIQRNNPRYILIKIFVILFSFFSVIFLSNYNGGVDINGFGYGKNLFLFYLNGFMGILLIMCISMFYIKKIALVSIISNGTIIILAFHGYATYEFLRLFYNLFQTDGNTSMRYAMPIAMAVVLLMAVPIVFIRKHFPLIIGGRK
jgi:hypothetical protein